MANVDVYLPAVDGGAYYLHAEGDSCKEIIHTLFTDDFAAPPVMMVIKVVTDAGKVVTVKIPYDAQGKASVTIDDEVVT